MKNIIIPIDFSVYSEYALKSGALFAKKHQANLILVHMLEMPHGYSDHSVDSGKSMVFLIKFTEKKIAQFLQKDYLEGVKIKVIIKHYTLFPELGKLAKELNASLIIMGSHGANTENSDFLGSNTEKVVRNSPIPILVLKEELQNIDFSNAVFVSDFKQESVGAYSKAKHFFNAIGVTPKLLFINKPDGGFVSTSEMKERFNDFLLAADGDLSQLSQFVNYDDYSVINGVQYYAKENNVSLISIATHGKSSLSKFFNKSISLDLSNQSNYPILSVKID